MNRSGGAGWAAGAVAGVLLGAAAAVAVDKDDTAEQRQEAAARRLEMAKENCERLPTQDRERCDNKAEADYLRELDTIRENAPSGVMGEGPDREGRQGKPTGR